MSDRITEILRKPKFDEEDLADLSEGDLRSLALALQGRANADALTGMPTRRFFVSEAVRLLERSLREGKPCAAGMADLDRFKAINDAYGHEAGDKILEAVAKCLLRHVRPEDRVCRFGGEEFAFLFVGVDELKAAEIADRLRRAVEKLAIPAGDRVLAATVSVGVAGSGLVDPGLRGSAEVFFDRLFGLADEALYIAKKGGRDRVAAWGVSLSSDKLGRRPLTRSGVRSSPGKIRGA